MALRTFFWHERVISPLELGARKIFNRSPYHYFKVGNAGDIFTQLIINNEYNTEAVNIKNEGNRLLLVGSISHRLMKGDILCGTGVKSKDISRKLNKQTRILGLRGPISYEAFSNAGFDMSEVKFLKDPGLLLRFYADLSETSANPSGAIFIPHYRERDHYVGNLPKKIKLVDIDDTPLGLARHILDSEIVYSSSLHGIIFAHALNRPAVFVKPRTDETLLKYEDYYSSMDLNFETPISDIAKINFLNTKVSPPDLKYCKSEFVFPSLQALTESGIVT